MAEDKKISQLGLLAGISGTERIPVAHNGANAAVELQQLKAYAGGGGAVENLIRFADGDPSSKVQIATNGATNSRTILPLEPSTLTEFGVGETLFVGFDAVLTDWFSTSLTNNVPVLMLSFTYDGASSQTEYIRLEGVELRVPYTGTIRVRKVIKLKDYPLTGAFVSTSVLSTTTSNTSPVSTCEIHNPRIYRGGVDYGWVESTRYLTDKLTNLPVATADTFGVIKLEYTEASNELNIKTE